VIPNQGDTKVCGVHSHKYILFGETTPYLASYENSFY